MTAVRVTGTTDPAEIAAVLAAVSAASRSQPQPSGYERWRRQRIEALRRTATSG